MGRIRFKISYVMPHAWFYKLKEVSKAGESLAYRSSSLIGKQLLSTTSKKVSYTSPVNHKAIDIPFPADTPKKSPLAAEASAADTLAGFTSYPEDIAILSPLHSVEIDRSFIKNQYPLDKAIMEIFSEEDHFHGFTSAPMSKSGALNAGATFDVKELEQKLKALGSEDRRKYYASPMLSGALPTPIPEASHVTRGSHIGHDECSDMQDLFSGGTEVIRRSPLRMVVQEGKLFDGGGSGEGFYRSSNESNSLGQSTSSSDTGFERGSSSVWERDFFSMNSDGSEAFTTGEDGGGSNHMYMQRSSRQPHRMPKERMPGVQSSPLLHVNGNVHSSKTHQEMSSGFYKVRHDDVAHAENGKGRSRYSKSRENVAKQRDINMYGQFNCASDDNMYSRSTHNCDNNMHSNGSHNSSDINTHGHNGNINTAIANAESSIHEWGGFKSSDYRSPSKLASPTNSVSSLRGRQYVATDRADTYNRWQHASADHASMYSPVVINGGKQTPLPNHQQSYQLPLVQYEASESQSKRASSVGGDQFSYMGCKERLLSGRTSFEQFNDKAASEDELEKMSNYTKFKLQQKSGTLGKNMNPMTGGFSPDVGIHRSMPSPELTSNVILPKYESYQGSPEYHMRGTSHSQRSPLFDHRRSSPSRKLGLNNAFPYPYEQGPSWSNKETLRAVREKTRDPSFQHFSTNAPGAVRSRVFDSFAMVKCSYDPKQDFKESMMEMIFEKGLNSSHDMVELLQCYLTLNPTRFHDTIVKVFTEVWSEVFQDV